jgi:hypothetical protein
MDMALFLAALLEGENYAEMIQLVTEYYPEPPTGIQHLNSVSEPIREKTREFLKTQISQMTIS